MSYSFTTEVIERVTSEDGDPQSGIPDAITKAAAVAMVGQQQSGTEHEARHAIEHAIGAAKTLAAGLGLHWKSIKVTVVGHANSGNVKTPGWGDEFCQVKVDAVEYAS